jgi:serine protease Do
MTYEEGWGEPEPPRTWLYWLTATVVGVAVVGGALLWPVPAGSEDDVLVGPTVKIKIPGGHGSAVHMGNGYYLTAAHVLATVRDGNATIRYDDGSEMQGIEVMWINTKYDVAMFRVEGQETVEARDLQCVDPKVGDFVTSEGNPLSLTSVTTYGRISSAPQAAGHWASVINIDAGVAPGMSGGPVFNEDGEIVGINVGMGQGMPIYLAVPGSVVCGLLGRTA